MNKRSIKRMFSRYSEIPVDEGYIHSFRADFVTAMKADTHIAEAKEQLARRGTHAIGVRWLVPTLMSFALIFTSGGTVFASQKSIPGEPLYSIKLATEHLSVALTTNPETKTQLQIAHAAERTKEINTIISSRKESSLTPKEEKDLSVALINFSNNLAEATIRIQELKTQGDATTSQVLNENLSAITRSYHEALDTSADETRDASLKERIRIASISALDIQQIVEQEMRKSEKENENRNNNIVKEESSLSTSTTTQNRDDHAPTRTIKIQSNHSSATEAVHIERENKEQNTQNAINTSSTIERIREIEKRNEEYQRKEMQKVEKEKALSSSPLTPGIITSSTISTSTPSPSPINAVREWVVEKVFKKKTEEKNTEKKEVKTESPETNNEEIKKGEVKEPEKTEVKTESPETKTEKIEEIDH